MATLMEGRVETKAKQHQTGPSAIQEIDQFNSPEPWRANRIMLGDARQQLRLFPESSIDLSLWSPPYYVGKSYERSLTFDQWCDLVRGVIHSHTRIIKPGGFLAINIGDILCFPDPDIPRFQANNVQGKKVAVTKEEILAVQVDYPDANRYTLAALLGCSEQTIQRRLEHNNVRGGKNSVGQRFC